MYVSFFVLLFFFLNESGGRGLCSRGIFVFVRGLAVGGRINIIIIVITITIDLLVYNNVTHKQNDRPRRYSGEALRGFESAASFFENLHRGAQLQLGWLEHDCDHFRDAVSFSWVDEKYRG